MGDIKMVETKETPKCYSNQTKLIYTNNDFQLLFQFADLAVEESGKVKQNLIPLTKITMSPLHFKSHTLMLQKQLEKYEKAFGEIKLKPQEKRKKA